MRLGEEYGVEELDLDEMGSGTDVAIRRNGARATGCPGVEDGNAVHKHAHTVVHGHAEAVDARLGEVEVAPPLDGEVVHIHAGGGRGARAPAVVDVGLIADHHGCAGEVCIVVIGGPPGGIGRVGGPGCTPRQQGEE